MVTQTLTQTAPAWIEVDLQAIRHNLMAVRRYLSSSTQILAVVKANAYGHGLIPVAWALVQAGVDGLAVASVVEAVTLREAGVKAPILVLGQCLPEEAPLVVEYRLIPSLGEFRAAKALADEAVATGCVVPFHLKVDTGMGRYGVWYEEAEELYRRLLALSGLKPIGIFSHLAMAGQSVAATEEQARRLDGLIVRLKAGGLPVGICHMANSAGLIRFPSLRFDMVRPGLILYGVSPLKEGVPLDLKRALSLKSRVRFLKTIPTGQTVGYGGTFRAQRPTRVATVPVGYAHGYVRALSDRAEVLIRGMRARVIGRITMEDLMVDVTDLSEVQVGDEVVLIGAQGQGEITALELAKMARTIPYEILAGLSERIPRIFLGQEADPSVFRSF
jgi:alanine racemase